MTQKISTEATAPITLSPLARVVRTGIQTVLSFALAEPVLIGLAHFNADQATKVASFTSGAVFVVSTLQNVLEHFGVLPVVGGKAAQ